MVQRYIEHTTGGHPQTEKARADQVQNNAGGLCLRMGACLKMIEADSKAKMWLYSAKKGGFHVSGNGRLRECRLSGQCQSLTTSSPAFRTSKGFG
jgi:hypothetical protein